MDLADPSIAAAYLSALVDGEGTVSSDARKVVVRIAMTDLPVLEAAEESLRALAISHAPVRRLPRTTSAGNAIFVLQIARRASIERLADVLDLRHPRKRARLAAASGFYVTGKRCACGEPATDRLGRGYACRRCKMIADGRMDAFRALPKPEPEDPKPCGRCGRLAKPLRRGRCGACAAYLRRHGVERPEEFFGTIARSHAGRGIQ